MATKQTSGASRSAQPTQAVKALVPITHDGTDRAVDEVFEIGTDCLPQLLEVKAVELVTAAVPELPAS